CGGMKEDFGPALGPLVELLVGLGSLIQRKLVGDDDRRCGPDNSRPACPAPSPGAPARPRSIALCAAITPTGPAPKIATVPRDRPGPARCRDIRWERCRRAG